MAQPRRIFSSDIQVQTLEQKTLEAITLETKGQAATVIQSRDQTATVIQSRDQQATVIQSRDQQAIVIQSTNQEATLLEAKGQDAETNTLAARNDRSLNNANGDYNASQQRRTEQAKMVPAPSFAAGFDANTGKVRVAKLGDSPVAIGVPVTNGAIADGQRVTMRGDGLVDSMPRVRPEPKPSIVITEKLPVKYLYSVLRGGLPEFYVGGHKSDSVKVPVPEDDRAFVRYPRVTNLGGDRWIVSYHLSGPGDSNEFSSGRTPLTARTGISIASKDGIRSEFKCEYSERFCLSGIGFGRWAALINLAYEYSGRIDYSNFSAKMRHFLGDLGSQDEYISNGIRVVVLTSVGNIASGSQATWESFLSPDTPSKGNYFSVGIYDENTGELIAPMKYRSVFPVATGKDGSYGIAMVQEPPADDPRGGFTSNLDYLRSQPQIHLFDSYATPLPKVSLAWFDSSGISEPAPIDKDVLRYDFARNPTNRFDVISSTQFTQTRIPSTGSSIVFGGSNSSTEMKALLDGRVNVEFFDFGFEKIKEEEFRCYPPDQSDDPSEPPSKFYSFADPSKTLFRFYNFSHEPIGS